MFRVVQEFLDAALEAADEETLCDAFQTAVQTLGFNHFAAGSAIGFTDLRPGTVFLRRYPEDWAQYYMDREFWTIDPTLRLLPEYGNPFLWSDPAITGRFSDAEQGFMAEAAAAGVCGGVTVPVRGAFMFPGQVNIYSSEREVAPDALAKLHNLSVYFFDLARRMAMAEANPQMRALTSVERECLLWASTGKSDWEVGAILGLPESSARANLENARWKLGVATRVQAVVQAVLSGQIEP